MSNYASARPRPVEETVAHKTDVLEWASIPDFPCDLDYRPPFAATFVEHLTPLLVMSVAAGLSIPVAALVGTFVAPYVASWHWGCAAIVVGLLMAIHCQLKSSSADEPQLVALRALLYLCGPAFAWSAIVLTAGLTDPSRALLYLTIAIPVAVFVADRIATHAVYWMTANIAVDSTVLTGWRADWARRFTGGPHLMIPTEEPRSARARAVAQAVLRARTGYLHGFIWIFAALLLPACVVLLANTRSGWPTIGLQIVFGGFAGLLLAALIRCRGELQTVIRCWAVFLHWFHFGKSQPMPPWMFHSPCGDYRRRRWLSIIAVGLTSVVLTYLAAHSTAVVAFSPNHNVTSALAAGQVADSKQSPQASELRRVLPAALPSFTPFLLAGVLSLAVPVFAHLLMVVVLIGPVIHSYYGALEA